MKLRILLCVLAAAVMMLAGCEDDNSPVGGGAVNTNPEGRLYVLNQSDNTIFVYDTRTMTRVDSLDAMIESPHFAEISPDRRYMYVVGRTSPGEVAKFDLLDNSYVDQFDGPGDLFPTAIMISPDGATGYVCDFTDPSNPGKLHRYNLNTMTFVDSLLNVGSATHDLRISSDGRLIVAGNFGADNVTMVYPEDDSVYFVDLDPGNPVPTGSPRLGPYGVAIDHNDSLAYIACRLSNEIRVLDLTTREIVDSIPIPIQSSNSNAGPTLMALSPDNDLLYITTQLENTVALLRISTRRVIAQLELGVMRPFGIVMTPDGSRYYVTCVNSLNPTEDRQGRVYVIDGATHDVVDSVDVGNNCFGLAFRSM